MGFYCLCEGGEVAGNPRQQAAKPSVSDQTVRLVPGAFGPSRTGHWWEKKMED
jgi:hypothetical protein